MNDNESMNLANRTKNPISRLLRHAWVRAVELFYPPPPPRPLRRPPHPQGSSETVFLIRVGLYDYPLNNIIQLRTPLFLGSCMPAIYVIIQECSQKYFIEAYV